MRHGSLLLLAVSLLLPLFPSDANAEVRVVRDRRGDYRGVRVLMHASRHARIWSPVRTSSVATLNPRGDHYGDLWPLIAEPGVAPNHPWVIWSRRDSLQDYDLVWTRWTRSGWQPFVALETGPERPGDDLDPDIAFDGNGRPYLVWWKDEDGVGQVYMSLYLVASWMRPYRVSDSAIDSRHPQVRLDAAGDILVRFETPEGVVERTVVFSQPATITDDIDPLDYVTAEALRYVDER